MAKISRRNFMRGAAVGTMGAAAAGLLTACGKSASSTTGLPLPPQLPLLPPPL